MTFLGMKFGTGGYPLDTVGTSCLGVLAVMLVLLATGCQSDDHSPPDTLSVEIDTRNGQPLRHDLHGFNSNMMSGDYGYLDDDFVALTQALAPKTMRFPGGTVANFYHWEPGGFSENELASTLSPRLNTRNKRNYMKLQKLRDGKIRFDDFMDLCKRLHITPVIVVNLWTGTPEESAGWVRYAKEKGYQITHWELGNEYYLPHYLNRYPKVETYMAAAKQHAAAMKAVDPNIKVSVCAAPIGFHKDGWLTKVQQRVWNQGLAKDLSFYDAYTVHVYAYKAVRDVPIEEMRSHLMGWIHYDVTEGMDYYEELFPKKEMWITEWNIANPANRVANTQLHAMYVGDFFLTMLGTPNVTQANFHVITGPGKGFPVFSRITPPTPGTFWKYGGEPTSDFGNTIRRAVYPAFQLIGEAFAEADTQFNVSVQNPLLLESEMVYKGKQVPGLQVRAVGSSRADTLTLLISNRTGEPCEPWIRIDGKRYTGDIDYRYVANESLSATNGGNAELAGTGDIQVRIQQWQGQATKLVIRENSFGILQIRR